MKTVAVGTVWAAIVLTSVAATRMGGWAVVTVEKISDYVVVGRPVTLTFMVRQHGVSPLGGLKPRIEARSGSRRVEGRAWEMPTTGGYRAAITIPEAGNWSVRIESGFGESRGALLPWKAIDSTAKAPAPLADAERGRQLFAAKGCITCHVHRDVDLDGQLKTAGPDLSDKHFAAQYLAQFLADPSIKPPTGNTMRMPNLALREQDIAQLVAFINSQRKVSAR